GFAAITFMATGNSTLQLESRPSMRGRVMALWAVGFMGSTPIGGPAVGWIVQVAGARVGLAVGACSCIVAAGLGWIAMRKLGPHTHVLPATGATGDEGSDALSIPLVAAETE